MQPQDVSAVSHEQAPIVVDLAVAIEVDAAPADGSEAKKNRKKKQKPVTSAETENGAQTQVSTIKKPKVKTTKKQKKAEREAAEEAAAESAQISEPTESAGTTEVAVIITEERELAARDKIVVPSAESGGVPEPTEAYLNCASAHPSRLLQPRRILIVMDLNGTLLFRPSKRRPSHFVARPHARVFMDYLLSNFTVAVWSSARPENVNKMVTSLLTPAQRAQCQVIWGRDRFGLSLEDYDSRVQCYKRLTRVWSDPGIMGAHPQARRGGRWDQSNTVLVDDSSEKARSEPHNLLQIPEYGGPKNELPHVLPQVHDYINELSYQADISRYIRENPFNLNPTYRLQG